MCFPFVWYRQESSTPTHKIRRYDSCIMELFAVCPVCTRACDVRTQNLGTFLSLEQRCPIASSTDTGIASLSLGAHQLGTSTFRQLCTWVEHPSYPSMCNWISYSSDYCSEYEVFLIKLQALCKQFFFLPTGLQGNGAATFSVQHISPACQIFHWTCIHSPVENITGCDAAAAQSGEQSYSWWWHESWLSRYLNIYEIVHFFQDCDILLSSE